MGVGSGQAIDKIDHNGYRCFENNQRSIEIQHSGAYLGTGTGEYALAEQDLYIGMRSM